MLRTLLQPRYAALSVLMLIVATICILAGTWQIARFGEKRGENSELRHNAHVAAVPVSDVLPLTGAGAEPKALAVQFRHVTAVGTYDAAHQSLVRHRDVDGQVGFLVVTPLRTLSGDLLVARGFLPQATVGNHPTAPVPPERTVQVTGWVQPAERASDKAASLAGGQVESVNPREQAVRLGVPVYAGYLELGTPQPGTAGLGPLPAPDLSNPAGGAVEPQHVAYVIQWYLFALLALAAPVAMARAETRHKDARDFDAADEPADPADPAGPATRSPEQDRAAKLADRYGRAR